MSTISVKKYSSGIILKYGEDVVVLDTGYAGEPTLLSHSHFDHMQGLDSAGYIFATQETFDTVEARSTTLTVPTESIQYNKSFSLRNIKITPYDAGHVLGSTMYLLEFSDGLRVLYTGDFNVVDSLVHSSAHPVPADILITEATYGAPEWVFPPRDDVHNNILECAQREIESGRVPVFKAYSLGKAQETIRLLQEHEYIVVTGNHAIDSVTEVYNTYGFDLRTVPINSPRVFSALDDSCVIVSSSVPHTKKNMKRSFNQNQQKAIESRFEEYSLSGWTLAKYSERGFPLSAHSDFSGLVSFVNGVDPRIVYCFTSNASEFSGYLVGLGLNAVPLE